MRQRPKSRQRMTSAVRSPFAGELFTRGRRRRAIQGRTAYQPFAFFGAFIKSARHLRNELKRKLKAENERRKAEGRPEIESLEEQAAKLYA